MGGGEGGLPFLGSSNNKDISSFASRLGSSYFGRRPNKMVQGGRSNKKQHGKNGDLSTLLCPRTPYGKRITYDHKYPPKGFSLLLKNVRWLSEALSSFL